MRLTALFLGVTISCSAVAEQLEARGALKATATAVISSEISAQVTELPFQMGDRFKEGETLAEFDCRLLVAQRQKVYAERKAAATKLENDSQLERMGSIGALEVALSKAELSKRNAELRIAGLNADRCKVIAPYNGKVVALKVNRFETVQAQQELLEIVSDAPLEAELVVPSGWSNWLNTETPLSIRIDETGQSYKGQVIRISPVIDAVSQTILIRAGLSNTHDELKPGMSGTASFVQLSSNTQ